MGGEALDLPLCSWTQRASFNVLVSSASKSQFNNKVILWFVLFSKREYGGKYNV